MEREEVERRKGIGRSTYSLRHQEPMKWVESVVS